jgi:hypothetical protein
MRSLIIISFIFLVACKEKSYQADDHLTVKEKDAIVQTLVRYVAKGPENVPASERFHTKYDSFYREKASHIRLEQYYPGDDQFYFLISQPASSLIEKRNATGGRFKLNDKGEMTEYEEVFRTWKMVPDTLRTRSYLLFKNMVEGKSLEPFYTKNSGGVEYIEFPDDRTFYDVSARQWRLK